MIGLFAVRGTSMRPNFLEGDLVLTLSPRLRPPKPGDVVVAAEPFGLVVHRVVRPFRDKDGRVSHLLRGDANRLPDPFVVAADQIVGVVIARLRGWGRLRLAVGSSTNRALRALRGAASDRGSGG